MDNPTLASNGEPPQTISFTRKTWSCETCHYIQDFEDAQCPNDGQQLVQTQEVTVDIVDPAVVADLVAVVNQNGAEYDTRPLTSKEIAAKQNEVDAKLTELRAESTETDTISI